MALLTLSATVLLTGCGQETDRDRELATIADAAAFIERYCAECHNPIDWSGDISFHNMDTHQVGNDAETWERVVRQLRTRTMPPKDARRPGTDEYRSLVAWLENELDRAAVVNPGRPALRRLNRVEYGNAIRDLLDLQVDVSSLLPPDDSAFGFDNIGDLLGVSAALLERYLSAADRVSALAVGDPETPPRAQTYTVRGDQSQALHLRGLPFGTVGGTIVEHNFPLDGEYEFQISLFRTNLEHIKGLEHPHQLEIAIDGERVFLEAIGADNETPIPHATITAQSDATDARLNVRVPVDAGARTVSVSFIRKIGASTNRLRPFDRSNAGTYDSTGRPHIETVTITGPFQASGPGDTASRRRIFSCIPASAGDEATCAKEILTTLARQAYRRPVSDSDVERLMPFFEDGQAKGGFERGIQLALRRILASPSFVFRPEADPEDVQPGTAYRISDVELATRLSFFLWSSIPDDTLIELAASGRLAEPSVLEEQVRRMLADPRSDALEKNFAGQWLHLRNLENIRPNTNEFPDFDNNLRTGFRRETELFFASIRQENRSIKELLTADYTFVDERLARHYGIPNIYGSRFRRVELGADLAERHGLLGKGGVLMATSHADRTAPSLRGKWILENLLGTPPPPPPADVPPLEAEPGAAPQSMRERMETHREAPACAGCHSLIDPLGFAMENFDAVGGYRLYDSGNDIDARGQLADGTPIDGVTELREALLADPLIFAQTFTEKLMTYALGRGLSYYDMPVVRGILRDAEGDNYRFESIVLGIVRSPPFTMRTRDPDGDIVPAEPVN